VTEEIVENLDVEEVAEDVEVVEKVLRNPASSAGQWYIIQTYSGQEHKIKTAIEERIKILGLEEKIFEILIPEEDTMEIKNNKKIEKKRKLYPGYVFVKMVFSDDLWYIIKRIPGISKFMGRQSLPTPVVDSEMVKVLRQVGVKVQKYQIDFEVGDEIKIISGPFRGYTGPVKELIPEKGKLRTLLMIFGRETPAELDFDQVERLK